MSVAPSVNYPGDGPSSLTDGLLGSQDIRDGRWLGFQGDDVSIVLEFSSPTPIDFVAVDVLQVERSWIFFPRSVALAVSNDGVRWPTVHEVTVNPSRESEPVVQQLQGRVSGPPIRYLRVDLENQGTNPVWHAAPGEPSWVFVDEVMVAARRVSCRYSRDDSS